MKGIMRKGDSLVFRVNLRLYPEKTVNAVFGKGKKVGDYAFYEGKFDEKQVYEGFNKLLEVMQN